MIKHQRYAHAHQFKRANRSLRRLKTYLGRVIRDIGRRIDGDPELEEIFAWPLSLSRRVLAQDQRQRGPKVYSLHAPEVECIGKGKAHRPYEFGVKVSVATTAHRSKGGQFVTHIAALPGNPYDGHTLATVIPAMEDMIGNTIERLLADAGYRGHNAPADYKFSVYTSGQKRRLTPQIKRELRRRAAIEPVIGHLKAEHRMGRNHFAHHAGDAANAVLAAAGYNFHLLLKWLEFLLSDSGSSKSSSRPSMGLKIENFTDDEIKLVLPGGKIEGWARIHYRTPHKITDLKNITFLKSGSDFCVTDRVRSLAILRSARVLLSATIATDQDL